MMQYQSRLIFALVNILLVAGLLIFTSCNQPGSASVDICEQWSADDNGVSCGMISVPRNWDDPGSGSTDLFYVRLHALNPASSKDPIIFLQGGPGGAATALVPFFKTNILRAQHDIIIMDQRGTGYSEPLCRDLSAQYFEVLAADLTPEDEIREIKKFTDVCSSFLVENNIDRSSFNSRYIIRDFEALRKTLGYRSWNIFGASYGSRLGLTYLRDFPESVTAAALQGLFPPEARLYEHLITNLHRSLELVFNACTEDPSCASANPGLREVFQTTIQTLESAPYHFQAEDREVVLNAQDYILMILLSLYSKSTIETRITSLIRSVRDRDDARIRQGIATIRNTFELINGAMYLSVAAYEELPFSGTKDLEAGLSNYPELAPGPAFFMSDPSILAAWQTSYAGKEEDQPVISDKPVLLVSGALDPVTPPGNALSMLPGLTNARHIVFPNESHSIFQECFYLILSQFFNDPQDQNTSECYQYDANLVIK